MMAFGLMFLVLVSVVLAAGSTSLLSFWVALELSSFFIIPLFNSSTLASKEVMWEYFLIQAVGSMGFLASSAVSVSAMTFLKVNNSQIFSWSAMAFVFLILKLGVPPFHGWALRVVEVMTWDQVAIFSVLSKVTPLLGIWVLLPSVSSVLGISFLFLLGFSTKGILESSLRRVMVYSSILNVAWIFLGMSMSPVLSGWLFLSYGLSVLGIALVMPKGVYLLTDMVKLCLPLTPFTLSLSILTVNMIGIPPTLGFFSKLNVLKGIFDQSVSGLVLLLSLMSMSFVLIYFWFFCFLQMSSKSTFRQSSSPRRPALAIGFAVVTLSVTPFLLI